MSHLRGIQDTAAPQRLASSDDDPLPQAPARRATLERAATVGVVRSSALVMGRSRVSVETPPETPDSAPETGRSNRNSVSLMEYILDRSTLDSDSLSYDGDATFVWHGATSEVKNVKGNSPKTSLSSPRQTSNTNQALPARVPRITPPSYNSQDERMGFLETLQTEAPKKSTKDKKGRFKLPWSKKDRHEKSDSKGDRADIQTTSSSLPQVSTSSVTNATTSSPRTPPPTSAAGSPSTARSTGFASRRPPPPKPDAEMSLLDFLATEPDEEEANKLARSPMVKRSQSPQLNKSLPATPSPNGHPRVPNSSVSMPTLNPHPSTLPSSSIHQPSPHSRAPSATSSNSASASTSTSANTSPNSSRSNTPRRRHSIRMVINEEMDRTPNRATVDVVARPAESIPTRRTGMSKFRLDSPNGPERSISFVDFLASEPPPAHVTSSMSSPQLVVETRTERSQSILRSNPPPPVVKPIIPEDLNDASLSEIISRVVTSDDTDLAFVLLFSYQTQFGVLELLQSVLKFYRDSSGVSGVQRRCLDLVRSLFDTYPADVNGHLAEVQTLLASTLAETEGALFPKSSILRDLVTLLGKGPLKSAEVDVPMAGNTPTPIPAVSPKGRFAAIHIHPLELARQITIIDQDLFNAIEPWEFRNLAWTRDDKHTRAPNILNAIVRFNMTSRWIQAELLCEEDLKTRIVILKHFLKVAAFLIEMQNYNGLMQIISAFLATPVYRLSKTFAGLSDRERTAFEKALELVDAEGNYKRLREEMSNVELPAVPYLGMYLTELTYISEGSASTESSGLVNVKKWAMSSRIVLKVLRYQQLRYPFAQQTPLMDLLLNPEVLDDDECYKLSLYIEPRHNQDPPAVKPIHLRHVEIPRTKSSIFLRKKKPSFSKPQIQPGGTLSSAPGATSNEPASGESNAESGDLDSSELDDESSPPSGRHRYSATNYVTDDAWMFQFPVTVSPDSVYFKHTTPTLKFKENGQLKSGTMIEFIEMLSLAPNLDRQATDLIATFHYVIEPEAFFKLLVSRFALPPLKNPSQFKDYTSSIGDPIRLRIAQILQAWITSHPVDFATASPLHQELHQFVNNTVAPAVPSNVAQNLLVAMAELDSSPNLSTAPPIMYAEQNVPAILPSLRYHPTEIARQLSRRDQTLVKQIPILSLRPKYRSNTNVGLIDRILSSGAALTKLVEKEFGGARGNEHELIRHWGEVAFALTKLSNWHSFTAISRALAPHLHLEPRTASKIITTLECLLGSDNHIRTTFLKANSSRAPTIPFFPSLLEDIDLLEKSIGELSTGLSPKIIDFEKLQSLAKVLATFILSRSHPYNFQIEPEIDDWLNGMAVKILYCSNDQASLGPTMEEPHPTSQPSSPTTTAAPRSIANGERSSPQKFRDLSLASFARNREPTPIPTQFILVIGWEGVGKSTLVSALNAQAQSHREDGSYLHHGRWIKFIEPALVPGQSLPPGLVPDILSAIILVYDVCSAPSVNGLFKWWQTSGRASVPTMLIGTHVDGARQIPSGVVASFARTYNIQSFEVSSVSGTGMAQFMATLIEILPLVKPEIPLPSIPSNTSSWQEVLEYILQLEGMIDPSQLPDRPDSLAS